MKDYTGLVLAGAAARGAYEAGALSVLLPKLEERGERPQVLSGTSAGALNAVFLASRADRAADVATKELVELWASIERTAVFDFSPFSGLSMLGQELGLTRRPSALVDTAPLRATLNEAIGNWSRIRRNIAGGHLDALAIATTNTSTGRTVVFVEGAICGSTASLLPERDDKKGIDYVRPRGGITAGHVLASAAVPVLFPPIELEIEKNETAWFVDGGLHLNTPIKPAIELGATRIAIIATDPATHLDAEPIDEAAIPDIDDLFLHFLQATLVDPLIEDMWRLAGINTLVELRDSAGGKRPIEYLFIGPRRRGELGAAADAAAADPGLGLFKPLSWLIGRQGSQDRELLSYLLFHPSFFTRAIELGIADARREVKRLTPSGPGWRIEPMRVH
jgi:NTE family protein